MHLQHVSLSLYPSITRDLHTREKQCHNGIASIGECTCRNRSSIDGMHQALTAVRQSIIQVNFANFQFGISGQQRIRHCQLRQKPQNLSQTDIKQIPSGGSPQTFLHIVDMHLPRLRLSTHRVSQPLSLFLHAVTSNYTGVDYPLTTFR